MSPPIIPGGAEVEFVLLDDDLGTDEECAQTLECSSRSRRVVATRVDPRRRRKWIGTKAPLKVR
jgi:hypothetical protein